MAESPSLLRDSTHGMVSASTASIPSCAAAAVRNGPTNPRAFCNPTSTRRRCTSFATAMTSSSSFPTMLSRFARSTRRDPPPSNATDRLELRRTEALLEWTWLGSSSESDSDSKGWSVCTLTLRRESPRKLSSSRGADPVGSVGWPSRERSTRAKLLLSSCRDRCTCLGSGSTIASSTARWAACSSATVAACNALSSLSVSPPGGWWCASASRARRASTSFSAIRALANWSSPCPDSLCWRGRGGDPIPSFELSRREARLTSTPRCSPLEAPEGLPPLGEPSPPLRSLRDRRRGRGNRADGDALPEHSSGARTRFAPVWVGGPPTLGEEPARAGFALPGIATYHPPFPPPMKYRDCY
eukprot:Sspe_Gene.25620::Locus_10333_Transcript_1_2_Confidence_0.500_Length_5282::g.25620::m.25620